MRRQALDNGKWFDLDSAQCWEEYTWFNGSNHISYATGSQWEHETLYRTRGGKWVLNHWSNYQGSAATWEEIDNDTAAKWLVKNNKDTHSACETEYAALEV